MKNLELITRISAFIGGFTTSGILLSIKTILQNTIINTLQSNLQYYSERISLSTGGSDRLGWQQLYNNTQNTINNYNYLGTLLHTIGEIALVGVTIALIADISLAVHKYFKITKK